MEKIRMVCAIALVSALSAGGAVPEGGLTWNLDASGVSGQTISGTFPNAEGVEGYAFESVAKMIWTNDVGLTGIYRGLTGDELLCGNETALYGNNPSTGATGDQAAGRNRGAWPHQRLHPGIRPQDRRHESGVVAYL